MRMRVDVCPASHRSSSPVQVFALVPACHAVVLAQSRSTLHEPGLQRLFSAHINTMLSTFLCPYSKTGTDEYFLQQASWGGLH